MIRHTAAPATARPYYQQALDIATSIAAQHEQARALEGLGLCHARDGQPGEGRECLRQALAIYQRIGSPRARDVEEATPRGHGRACSRGGPAIVRQPAARRHVLLMPP